MGIYETMPNYFLGEHVIIVDIKGQIAEKKRIIEYCENALAYFLTDLSKQIEVNLTISKELDSQAFGYCSGDDSSVDIELAKVSDGFKLSIDDMMLNLAHELIHAKQFIKGELNPNLNIWRHADYSNVPYSIRPWEKQAYMFEDIIYNLFWKNGKINNKKTKQIIN
jgi:hypothetical protein